MSIYKRFQELDVLLENGSITEDLHFEYCCKLTDVLLELAKHGMEVISDQLQAANNQLAELARSESESDSGGEYLVFDPSRFEVLQNGD
jgi:hypothetical protein